MKNSKIKIANAYTYWCDFEIEIAATYIIKWENEESQDFFFTNEESFVNRFYDLTKSYRILEPINYSIEKLKELSNVTHEPVYNGMRLLNYFYYRNNSMIYPTFLFLDFDNIISSGSVVRVDPLCFLNDALDDENFNGSFNNPVRIEMIKRSNQVLLYLTIDNDVFFPNIDNKKTRRDPNIGGYGNSIDNSELSYLNTPRFNSFLRELRKLCFQFKATTFSFESSFAEDLISKDGISLNKEVIYYEDILDILPLNHSII